jgi:hypothetical protein
MAKLHSNVMMDSQKLDFTDIDSHAASPKQTEVQTISSFLLSHSTVDIIDAHAQIKQDGKQYSNIHETSFTSISVQLQEANILAQRKQQNWKIDPNIHYNRFRDDDNDGHHASVHGAIIYLTGLECATHAILNQHDIKWYLPESDLQYPKECDFKDVSDRHAEVIRFLIRLYDCISAYAAQRNVSPDLIYSEGLNSIDRLNDLKSIRKG